MTTVHHPLAEATAVQALLGSDRYVGVSETDYQDAIAKVLSGAGMSFRREVRLTSRDRIDFMVGTVGVEVKVQGTRAGIIRQLGRYAQSEQVSVLILASARIMLTKNVPSVILGTPVLTVPLRGALL